MAKITDYQEQTRKIQNAAIVLFAGLAIAAGVLMDAVSYTFTLGYMVRDQIASQGGTANVYGYAARNLHEMPVRWLLVATLLTAAVFTLLKLTKWRNRYNTQIKNGLSTLRWVETGVVGAMMIAIVALLSGITDVLMIKALAAFVLLSAVLNLISERQNKGAKKPVRSAFLLATLVGAVPVVYILITALLTYVFGMIVAPWYVYALYAVVLLGFTLLTRTRRNQLRATSKLWKDNMYVERRHEIIAIVTLVLFALVLIVGLLDK